MFVEKGPIRGTSAVTANRTPPPPPAEKPRLFAKTNHIGGVLMEAHVQLGRIERAVDRAIGSEPTGGDCKAESTPNTLEDDLLRLQESAESLYNRLLNVARRLDDAV